MPEVIHKINDAIDRAFELSYLPQMSEGAAGTVGSWADSLLGTDIESTMASIGKGLPRMLTEAALTIPMAAATGGAAPAALWLQRLSKLGQLAGYGSAGTRGYAETESPLGALISAGTLGLGNKLFLPASLGGLDVGLRGSRLAEQAAGFTPKTIASELGGDLLSPNLIKSGTEAALDAKTLTQQLASGIGRFGTDVSVATGLNEMARQGMLSVGPNAVGLDAPERNPLSTENVVGNVMNAIPMAIPAVVAARVKFRPIQVEQLAKWVDSRKDAEAAYAGYDYEGMIDPMTYHDTFGRVKDQPMEFTPTGKKMSAYPEVQQTFASGKLDPPEYSWDEPQIDEKRSRSSMIRAHAAVLDSQFQVLDSLEERGATEDAAAQRQNIIKYFAGIGQDLGEADLDLVKETVQQVDVRARQLSPMKVRDLATFAREANSVVAALQERDPLVVKQLQDKGLLWKVTPETLAEELEKQGMKFGNVEALEFNYKVALQVASNRIRDGFEEALRLRKALPADPTQTEWEKQHSLKSQPKIDLEETKYIAAMGQVPADLRRPLFERFLAIRSKEPFFHPKYKQYFHPEAWWKENFIRAMSEESYQPNEGEYGTVLWPRSIVVGGKRKTIVERLPLEELVRRDPETDEFVVSPGYRPVGAARGGKEKWEVGYKDIERQGGPRPEDLLEDETEVVAEFARKVTEEGKGTPLAELGVGGKGGVDPLTNKLAEGQGTPEVPDFGEAVLPEVTKSPDVDWKQVRYEQVQRIMEVLPHLTDEQLWQVARPAFAKKVREGDVVAPRDPYEGERKGLIKSALLATLEDLKNPQGVELGENGKRFLEQWGSNHQLQGDTSKEQLRRGLRVYFRFQDPGAFFGAKPTKNANHYDRLKFIFTRLDNKETVRTAERLPRVAGESATFDTTAPAAGEVVEGKDFFEGKATYENTQPKGSFPADAVATIRSYIYKEMGVLGIGGTMREVYTEMATALLLSAPKKTDFYSLYDKRATGRAGITLNESATEIRGMLSIDTTLKGFSDPTFVLSHLIETLAHEISHLHSRVLESYINEPDVFSQQQLVHLWGIRKLSMVLTPSEKDAIIRTLEEGLIPEEYRAPVKAPGSDLRYGSHSNDEFVATITGLVAKSLLGGKDREIMSALEVLDFASSEVREFARGVYRSIHDVLYGLQETLADPFIRKVKQMSLFLDSNPFFTSQAFNAVVGQAREGASYRQSDLALAQARSFLASAAMPSAEYFPMTPARLFYSYAKDIAENNQKSETAPMLHAMPNAVNAINTASRFINPRTYDRNNRQGVWMRFFAPFAQRMEDMKRSGFDLARPIANLSLGLESTVTRLRSSILSNFLVKGKDGQVALDADNALVRLVSENKTGPWRDVGNEVDAWQQEVGAKQMFAYDQDGRVVVNTPENGVRVLQKAGYEVTNDPKGRPIALTQKGITVEPRTLPDPLYRAWFNVKNPVSGTAARWDTLRARLSPEVQQEIIARTMALDETGQNGARVLIRSLVESTERRTAFKLMMLDRGLHYEDALGKGREIVLAYQQGNELALQQLLPAPNMRKHVDDLLAGPDGLIELNAKVQEKLESRPGYRSEALPDEWLVRFKNADGEIKFLSAKSLHKANFLMNRLRREDPAIKQAGEIIKKSELKDFSEFDDPDTLLRKYAEVEQGVWQRNVSEVEKEFGPEVAEAMRRYLPGGTVQKELSAKGLNQYLLERKSKVDRTRFDYVDGTMSWAGRLAASVAFRQTREMKDLILADPRAKMYPSFESGVNDHFDNLMSPTSQWAREVKTFSSGMMLGLSTASALMNASQSLVSLIPVLIQYDQSKMGPVGAYKAMFRAIGDAARVSLSKSWQSDADAAARIDPKKWTLDQAKAALYRQRVEDGGINHGIILDEIFSPTDQKSLMAAKFGHGNYGPVTVGEMARNGVYLVAQLSLKPFGWVEHFNNKISFMAGVEQGYKQGLKGDALFDFARTVQTLSTYGGGKANVPGYVPALSNDKSRSAVGLVNNLQQYGFAVSTTYFQLIRDALGKSSALSPQERRQAMKAFGTMFATQTAMAGALGLPFAAAALTVMEKVTGVPANQLVREGIASLGDDEEQGAWFAETALNGIGNQMFGLDVSSRLGVSNLLGTSSYRGFNLQDMAGPTVSVAANMIRGLGLFGQNEPEKALKTMVPNVFKNAIELSSSAAKYGDLGLRDNGGDLLYTPTTSQAAWYVAGFRPRELSQKRQAQAMMTLSNERTTRKRGQEMDRIAQSLLSGNPQEALVWAQAQKFADPTQDPRTFLRSIVDRAVDSVTEKDLLAFGPTANEAERQRIAGTFGQGVVTRQSELQRAMLKAQLGAQVGLTTDGKSFQRATLVDALVQSQGMPRSQALRLVDFLQ